MKKQKQPLKKTLEQNHQILEALASKDKQNLKKCSYVAYNNIIEFPQPVAFTIKRLKDIIKEVEKTKLKEDNIMMGIMIEMPIPEELKGKIKNQTKCFKTKSIKKKYGDVK